MSRKDRKNIAVIEFILRNLEEHSADIIAITMQQFALSRPSVLNYMNSLITKNLVEAHGKTFARRYKLKVLVKERFTVRLNEALEEHIIWRKIIPLMQDVKRNIVGICEYGFNEMLNNAKDHSASYEATITYEQNYNEIQIWIEDRGIGIFEKIKNHFKLADARNALLELAKGKLTSSPAHHAGQGIFFTSRMFDRFYILSGHLFYTRKRQKDDEWLIEVQEEEAYEKGTVIGMKISTNADWTTREIFEKYQGDGFGFRKTHVPINLGRYPGEHLVSRSEAKRILARFDDFSEVMLDFSGVETIGQAFADEIFRVFKNGHPDIKILAINTSLPIKKMIRHVQGDIDPDKDQYNLFTKQ